MAQRTRRTTRKTTTRKRVAKKTTKKTAKRAPAKGSTTGSTSVSVPVVVAKEQEGFFIRFTASCGDTIGIVLTRTLKGVGMCQGSRWYNNRGPFTAKKVLDQNEEGKEMDTILSSSKEIRALATWLNSVADDMEAKK